MNFNKFFFGIVLFFLSSNYTYGHYTTVVVESDPHQDLRHWLYKMEPYFATNEDIKRNKVFYEVIIERHIRNIESDEFIFNSIFVIPPILISALITSWGLYDLGYHKLVKGFWPKNLLEETLISMTSGTVGTLLTKYYFDSKKDVKDHIAYNERILAALRKL